MGWAQTSPFTNEETIVLFSSSPRAFAAAVFGQTLHLVCPMTDRALEMGLCLELYCLSEINKNIHFKISLPE